MALGSYVWRKHGHGTIKCWDGLVRVISPFVIICSSLLCLELSEVWANPKKRMLLIDLS